MTRQELLERKLEDMRSTEPEESPTVRMMAEDFLSASPADIDDSLNTWMVWGDR
jgi:hypothetical protein